MQLLIDTTQKGLMVFEIWQGKTRLAERSKVTERLSEELLPALSKFLNKQKVSLKGLKKILVNSGPGGFSSTRTGVATANALSLGLGIPVAVWPSGRIKEMVVPKYDKEPNITMQKFLPLMRGRKRGGHSSPIF